MTSRDLPTLDQHLRAEHKAKQKDPGDIFSLKLERPMLVQLRDNRFPISPRGTILPPYEQHATGRHFETFKDEVILESWTSWADAWAKHCAAVLPASAANAIVTVFESEAERDDVPGKLLGNAELESGGASERLAVRALAPSMSQLSFVGHMPLALYPADMGPSFFLTMTKINKLAKAKPNRFAKVRSDTAFLLHTHGMLRDICESECCWHAYEAAVRGLFYSHIRIVTRKGKHVRAAGTDDDDDEMESDGEAGTVDESAESSRRRGRGD